jgi:phage terminase small subunit
MRQATKAKYDKFIMAYVSNNKNGAAAAVSAGYAEKSAHVTASKLLKNAYICQEITYKLQEIKNKAEEKFNVTLEQRLEWLTTIVKTGLRETADLAGNQKAENLQASTAAVRELNVMLGTDDSASDNSISGIEIRVVR